MIDPAGNVLIPESRPVPGYEGIYRVWNTGLVQSSRLPGSGRPSNTWRDLIPRRQGSGHLAVQLCMNGVAKNCRVHALVLTAFVGPCPDGMEGCHDPDPDPSNNSLDNLRWDTRKSNSIDSKKHGRFRFGADRAHAKLTEEKVHEIRRLYRQGGLRQVDIGLMFGITQATVGKIVRRLKWAHI